MLRTGTDYPAGRECLRLMGAEVALRAQFEQAICAGEGSFTPFADIEERWCGLHHKNR